MANQSDTDAASEQFDLTLGMDFDLPPARIRAVVAELEQAEVLDADDTSDEVLAEYAAAMKALEDAAETARKEVFEAALDGRTEVDDEVGPLVKRQGSRRYVADEPGAIDAIEGAGGDPTEAMSLKATDAADLLEALGIDTADYIGVNEYTYFRRQG